MIRVGLTGNIGSGKTTVAHIFSTLGVPIFYADIEAKIIGNLPETQKEIVACFGDSIVDDYGKLDRKMLGSLVFKDKEKLKILNRIIHPKVANAWKKFCDKNRTHDYLICEAAILFESGFDKFTDINITVCADEKLRIDRISMRDGLPTSEIEARINNQWSEIIKSKLSNYTVDNNEKLLLVPQILKIDNSIKSN